MHPNLHEMSREILLEEAELDDEMDESYDADDDKAYASLLASTLNGDKSPDEEFEEEYSSDENVDVFPCAECTALFSARRDLRAHARAKHHLKCFWTCKTCGAAYPDVEAFKVKKRTQMILPPPCA